MKRTMFLPVLAWVALLAASARAETFLAVEYFEAEGGATCRFGYLLPAAVADAIQSAEIQLLAPDGKALLTRRMEWEGRRGELRVDVPVLPEGRYTVAATLPGLPLPITRTITGGRAVEEPAPIRVGEASYSGRFAVDGATFTVDDYRVSVETGRYRVDFLDLGIRQVTDKATGRVYCLPEGMRPGGNASLFLKSHMPAQPSRTFRHLPGEAEAQTVHIARVPRGVEYIITGLVHPGDADSRRYHAEAMLGLRIEVDPETGDLVLTALADAGVEEQFGVYDEGIFAMGFNLGTVDPEIRFINPSGQVAPVSGFRGWDAWWPVHIPASLMVFEAPSGECLAVWAEDTSLEYGRKFRINDGTVEFHTVNADATWRVGELEAPIWRLNLFDSWEPAAMRYREVMERTLDLKETAEREPERGRSIRLVLHAESWRLDGLEWLVEQGVPVEALMAWETQGWLAGYGVELLSPKRGLWFPNYPFERPTHYRGGPHFRARTEESQQFGVPVFPYTLMFYGMSEPFETDSRLLRAPGMDFRGGGRLWWVLYTNMIKELADRYGLQGMYLDCSWVGPQHDPRGKVDGLTVYQAHVQGRQYMRDRMSPTILYGERQHELTLPSDFIALLWVHSEVHPINNYLFGPYTWRFNTGGGNDLNAILDAHESLGAIPWVFGRGLQRMSHARQERAILNANILFWGREMLTPYYPPRYDPDVLVYLRGRDGTEYRTRRGSGIGLVRVGEQGEDIVWWRTRNAAEFDRKSAGIDGWVAYDGDRIIGLNPAERYALLETIDVPPVRITRIPEGSHLTLSRVEDGYWVAGIGGQDLPEHVDLTIAAPGRDVSFIGAAAVSGPDVNGLYRVRMAPGRALAACWDVAPERVDQLPFRFGTPAGKLHYANRAGVTALTQHADGMQGGQRALTWRGYGDPYMAMKDQSMQADYLLALPDEAATLTAAITGGCDWVRVRVNGGIIAELEHPGDGTTALEVSLADFAGQTVLLTFDARADRQFSLHDPRLVKLD